MYSRNGPVVSDRREQTTSVTSLLAEIDADPSARIVLGIVGMGGTGKRGVLDEIEQHYRAAGIPVHRRSANPRTPRNPPEVTIIDDAHDLADDDALQLHDLLLEGEQSLIVSYRTSSRSVALARLVRVIERERPPLLLGPLSRREVALRLREATGTTMSPEVATAITELTGGMPWLVQRVSVGLRTGFPSATGHQPPHDGAVEQLALDLAGLDADRRAVLLALAVGFEPTEGLSTAVGLDDSTVHQQVTRLASDGYLLPTGAPVPIVKLALLRGTPAYRVHELQSTLVERLAASGRTLDHIAATLVEDGMRDPHLTKSLADAGDQVLSRNPAEAAKLYADSAVSSEQPLETAARRAHAAWALGDLDEAGILLDELLSQEDPPDLLRGVQVAAAVWAERGMMKFGAEMYRWLGSARSGQSAALGEIAMIASGDRPGADEMVTSPSVASPTTFGVATTLMSRGIRSSLDADADRALSSLIRASDMMTASQSAPPLPDDPAALAAIVALHRGELDVAASVLDRALSNRIGANAYRQRLILLRGWTAMQADRLEEARSYLDEVRAQGAGLRPRDEFVLRALETGLARRSDDQRGLTMAWQGARAVVLHVPIDLFSLLPLGELMIAAARLDDSKHLAGHVADAWSLLGRLGDPPLWSIGLHWSAVQAAILAKSPTDLAPHATALARFASDSSLAMVLATAGKTWVHVLAGNVRVSDVDHAARALASAGYPWDASRLAGHAAARVEERRDMTKLLACARDLRAGVAAAPDDAESEPQPARPLAAMRPETARDRSGLSAREREVGRLVLAGMTYKEIGETIFISARTAEHHIARIRRQLGATSRSDLLTRLRIALGPDDPETPHRPRAGGADSP